MSTQECLVGRGEDAALVSRNQTLRVWPLPGGPVNSTGRAFPGGVEHAISTSPSTVQIWASVWPASGPFVTWTSDRRGFFPGSVFQVPRRYTLPLSVTV
jgi:hypothetical protein